jgi:TonB family protein
MKNISALVFIVLLTGCSTTKQISEMTPPRLVVQPTLPLFNENTSNPPRYIDLSLFITSDGAVSKVRLLSSSGSAKWDSLAVEKIRQWKFIPATINDEAVSVWYQFQAIIRYEAPKYISIATVICKKQDDAERVYEILKRNPNLEDLDKQFASDTSSVKIENLGEIDINCYPKNIRNIISGLKAEEFTKPLNLDHEYYIFKRLKD